MKRLFVMAVLTVVVCLTAFAEVVIEAEGWGETLDQAKENAIVALAEKVFPNTVVTETGTQTNDGDDGYSSSFSQKSSRSVVGELPGIDYKIVSRKRNSYTVSTKITGDRKTLAYYSGRLEEEKESAEELYRRYSSLDPSDSATERRKALAKVIEYYYYYNIYSNIILRLGGSPDDIDIPSKISVLQVDYESLLAEEENELLARSSVSSITREIEDELKKNREAQEEYRKAQEESNAQAELQRKLILDQKISEIISSVDTSSVLDVDSSLTLSGFSNYLDVIQSANYYLAEASSQYDSLIAEQNEYIENAFSEEAAAIRNRTYPIAQQSNGSPTALARSIREDEVAALRAQKDKEKEEALATINEKLCDEIQKRYNYLYEAIQALSEKEFSVYSSRNEIHIPSTPVYDGNRYRWTFTVEMDEPFSFKVNDISLGYAELTGKEIPTDPSALREFYSSTEYTDTVETYNKLLVAGGYDFSVSFTAEVNPDGYLTVKLMNLIMTFRNGKTVEISLSGVDSNGIDLGFEESSYRSYTWLDRSQEEHTDSTSSGESEYVVSSSVSNENPNVKTSTTTESSKTIKSTSVNTTTVSEVAKTEKTLDEEEVEDSLHIRHGFSFQTGYVIGGIYDASSNLQLEIGGETRFFWSVLFAGADVQFMMMFDRENIEKTTDGTKNPEFFQIGVFPVIGIKFSNSVGIACRVGYNSRYGMIINPYATVSLSLFTKNPELDDCGFLNFLGGCYINTKSGKVAGVVGMSIEFESEE